MTEKHLFQSAYAGVSTGSFLMFDGEEVDTMWKKFKVKKAARKRAYLGGPSKW